MTEKQRKFADEYLIDCNATRAAISAGYSEKTAYSQGQRLLKNVEVKTYVEEKMNEVSSDKIATATEVMEYLTSVMRGKSESAVLALCGDGCQEVIYKSADEKERLKAAELLGKRYAIFTDKTQLDENISVTIVDDLGE